MISTDITPELVTHTAAGKTSLSEVTQATRRWYDHETFDPDLPILWDFRAAEFSPPDEEVAEWASTNLSLINALRAGRKTALVFDDPGAVQFTVDLLEAHDWRHKVRVYGDDMEAARAWLTSSIR